MVVEVVFGAGPGENVDAGDDEAAVLRVVTPGALATEIAADAGAEST